MTHNPEILTPREVADLFGVDPKTVIRWANAGRIPNFRTPGHQRRFYRADIEPFLRASKGKTGPSQKGS